MNFRFQWPAWIPHPHAWIETFILALLMAPLGFSVRYYGELGLRLTMNLNNPGPLLLLLAVGMMGPFVAFAYVHSFFWGKRPQGWPAKLPAPRSIWEGFYALTTAVVALTAAIVAASFLVDFRRPPSQKDLDAIGTVATVVWFATALYLYHVETMLWGAIAAEFKAKYQSEPPRPSNTPPVPPMPPAKSPKQKSQPQGDTPFGSFDEIESELKEIRAEMGKPPKQ